MRVHDDQGRALDATVELVGSAGDARITFESRGPARNVDYRPAFDAILVRMSALKATIADAVLVSKDTQHLLLEQRRLRRNGIIYPIRLTDEHQALSLSSELRSAAAETGRQPGAKGGGNRTKRVQIQFRIDDVSRALSWVAERLLSPTQAVEALAVTEYVRPRSSSAGQGFGLDPEARRLIEEYSMQQATDYFAALGATVRDVSRQESYDLACTQDGQNYHVEVKGTTGAGASVLLTHNEVKHAQTHFPNVVLFVLSEIRLEVLNGKRVASGGKQAIFQPWKIAPDRLVPLTYSLVLDHSEGK